jgi:hypothetical protein
MADVTLDTARIRDWDSFHDVCSEAFVFPDFYGRNMNAWIACLTYLEEGDGMSMFVLGVGERLSIHLPEFDVFTASVPEISEALLYCTAFVNKRYLERNETPRLSLVLQ